MDVPHAECSKEVPFAPICQHSSAATPVSAKIDIVAKNSCIYAKTLNFSFYSTALDVPTMAWNIISGSMVPNCIVSIWKFMAPTTLQTSERGTKSFMTSNTSDMTVEAEVLLVLFFSG